MLNDSQTSLKTIAEQLLEKQTKDFIVTRYRWLMKSDTIARDK